MGQIIYLPRKTAPPSRRFAEHAQATAPLDVTAIEMNRHMASVLLAVLARVCAALDTIDWQIAQTRRTEETRIYLERRARLIKASTDAFQSYTHDSLRLSHLARHEPAPLPSMERARTV